MSFLQDAAGEVWGAVSNPVQTVTKAAQNVWQSIGFNVGYLSGDPVATAQVQQDINSQQQAQADWLASNPGATEQDYSQYLTNTFSDRFSNYVDQGNKGSADNPVSQFDPKALIGIGILIVIISLFRR